MQHLQPNTTLQGGKYRIERVLGQGGFGNTYVGYNTEFEETVAIKEFFMKGVTERDETTSVVSVSNADNVQQFEEQREKFKKEARRLRKLKNEHIVKVHDLFEENGTAYYVMDYIDGESLAEKIKKTGQPFTEAEVRSILSQILEALKEVHQNEIWHLDLKPGNIMIDKSGNAYLIDFGAMAIDIEEDEEDAFDFPATISDEMRKLVVWMMQPKRKARPQNVDGLIEKLEPKQIVEEKLIVAPEPEPKPESELDSEETLLIGTSDILDKPKQQPKDDEENQTILVVSKKKQDSKPHQVPSGILPQRAIKVGDFIFEDGSYADKIENDRKPIGVLFSYYGGAHGQIMSAFKPDENMSINGKELKWHEASIAEWVEVIQNLCYCKVNFQSGDYRYFSDKVHYIMSIYQVKGVKYATKKSISGVAYIVNLEKCMMTPFEDDNTILPYIYISEF